VLRVSWAGSPCGWPSCRPSTSVFMAVFRRGEVLVRDLALPAAIMTGMAFAAPIAAYSARRSAMSASPPSTGSGSSRCFLFSGDVLSR